MAAGDTTVGSTPNLTVDWLKTAVWAPLIAAHIDFMDKQRARSAARAQFGNTEKSARKQYGLWVHIVRTAYPQNDAILLDYGIAPRKPRKHKVAKAGQVPVQPVNGGAPTPAQQGGNAAAVAQSENHNPVTGPST